MSKLKIKKEYFSLNHTVSNFLCISLITILYVFLLRFISQIDLFIDIQLLKSVIFSIVLCGLAYVFSDRAKTELVYKSCCSLLWLLGLKYINCCSLIPLISSVSFSNILDLVFFLFSFLFLSFLSKKTTAYKLELKMKSKNHLLFIENLEKIIRSEDVKKSYTIIRQKNTTVMTYITKEFLFLKPKIEIKIMVKRTDNKNSHLTLEGKPLSHGYISPKKYINNILLELLSE